MRILLDAHTFLWFVLGDAQLSNSAKAFIVDPANQILFSPVSYWEIAIKISIGKFRLPDIEKNIVEMSAEDLAAKTLPLYTHHSLRVAEMPLHHRDPFDRLLIAQAQAEGLPLMTADPVLAKYDVDIIWAGTEPAPS